MIKTKSINLSVAAAAVDTAIGSLTVPEGQRYVMREIGIDAPASCKIKIYIQDEQMFYIDGDNFTDTRRIVVNWDLGPGMEVRVTGDNGTGGALIIGAVLVYDNIVS